MKNPLEKFYSAFGDRGVMFILFAFSVVLHSLLSAQMELPAVHPDEIGVASIAALYTGRDWSPMMGQISCYYGYIQALFYIPLFFLFGSNPYALYKSMLVMNGIIISFIPLLAYHLASKLGVEKVWQKLTIALCSGFYITYIAHSKFIWNEAICSFLPWLLIWCVFMAWDRKSRYSRFSMSIVTGFLCAVCYAAHTRLIAVVIALVLTLIISQLWLREKIVNLPVMLMTMALSFLTEHFSAAMIKQMLWHGKVSLNTMESGVDRLSGLTSAGGISRLVGTIFGHLYTFATSTLGLGAMALVVFFLLVFARITEDMKSRRERGEDGTKEYAPPERRYSARVLVFGLYGFLSVGGSLVMSALFKFNSSKIDSIKDLVIFGRYTDNVTPLAIMLTLVFLFLYGASIKQLLWGAGVYAYLCACFAVWSFPMLQSAKTFRESPVLGLLPWRIGENYAAAPTKESFLVMSSCVFTAFALALVVVSCFKKRCSGALSVVMCAAVVYTTIFAGGVYLPMRAEENAVKTETARALCDIIYNDPQSPQVVVYSSSTSRNAALLQFLNPDTNIAIIRKQKNIPENCILIAPSSLKLTIGGSREIVGVASDYTVYACGESAGDYFRYKNASDSGSAVQNGGAR